MKNNKGQGEGGFFFGMLIIAILIFISGCVLGQSERLSLKRIDDKSYACGLFGTAGTQASKCYSLEKEVIIKEQALETVNGKN